MQDNITVDKRKTYHKPYTELSGQHGIIGQNLILRRGLMSSCGLIKAVNVTMIMIMMMCLQSTEVSSGLFPRGTL